MHAHLTCQGVPVRIGGCDRSSGPAREVHDGLFLFAQALIGDPNRVISRVSFSDVISRVSFAHTLITSRASLTSGERSPAAVADKPNDVRDPVAVGAQRQQRS